MNLIEKTSAWAHKGEPVQIMSRTFREATDGDVLPAMCKAYGVEMSDDPDETRRRLRDKMLSDADSEQGSERTEAHA